MSKRYGRNQKRKHREQIEKAQDDLETISRLYNAEKSLLKSTIEKLRFRIEPVDMFSIDYSLGASMAVPPEHVQRTVANLRKVTYRSQLDLRETTAARLSCIRDEVKACLSRSLMPHMVVTEHIVPGSPPNLIIECSAVIEIKNDKY